MTAPLHIVDDLFITVDCRIQAIVIFLSIRRRLICVGFAVLVDRAADKLNARLLVFTDRYKVIICFDSRSPSYLFQMGVTQMSTWAMREEIITTNFAKFVQLPENTKKEKETFTDAEISKLEADGSDTAKIILMLIYTGMRIGELFSLAADLKYSQSTVRRGICDLKKAGLLETEQRYRKKGGKSSLLFKIRSG